MKNYFNSNIQYYLRHLHESGCLDPVQQITTDFVDYMKNQLNDNQKDYVHTQLRTNKNKRIIEDALILLKTIKVNESDKKTIDLIKEGLKSLL